MSQQSQEIRNKILQLTKQYYEAEFLPKIKSEFSVGDCVTYGGRVFDNNEIEAAVEASLDFWLTTGRCADEFEVEFARFLSTKHCMLVNSGSSANLLAFMDSRQIYWEIEAYSAVMKLLQWLQVFRPLLRRLYSMAQFRFLLT